MPKLDRRSDSEREKSADGRTRDDERLHTASTRGRSTESSPGRLAPRRRTGDRAVRDHADEKPGDTRVGAGALPESVQSAFARRGSPLEEQVQNDMESRFGHDFEAVRVHDHGRAAAAARRLNARAFTVGTDVAFDTGEYAPESSGGRRLLAHELAHVVQQRRGGTEAPPLSPQSETERAAESAARAVATETQRVSVSGGTAEGIARQPRSLYQSLDLEMMTQDEIQQEIELIRDWLVRTSASAPEREHLRAMLQNLEGRRVSEGIPEPRYNLKIGDEVLREASTDEVLRALSKQHQTLHSRITWDVRRHEAQKAIRDDHPIVGWISDRLGAGDIPRMSVWATPRRLLASVESALEDRNVEATIAALQAAKEAYLTAHKKLYRYIEGTIKGAGRAVTGLEITRDVSFATVGAAATVATGGVATGALIGAGVTTTGSIAQQARETQLGLRQQIDWAAIAFDAVFDIVTSKIPGLGDKVAKRILTTPGVASLGRRAAARLSSEAVQLLQGRAMATLKLATAAAFDNLRGAPGAMSVEKVLSTIADQLTDPKYALRDFLIGTVPGGAASRGTKLPRTRAEARARRAEGREPAAPPEQTPTAPTESTTTAPPSEATPTTTEPPLSPTLPPSETVPMRLPDPEATTTAPPRGRRVREIQQEVAATVTPPELPAPAKATQTGIPVPPETRVWVNTRSGIAHPEGTTYFRNTKVGVEMTAGEALARGHRMTRGTGTAQRIGREGELIRFLEVNRTPKEFTDQVPTYPQRKLLYDAVESGQLSVREFAKMFGDDGTEQVTFRTPLGPRRIDHMFPEGTIAVLRESKQVENFQNTGEIRKQLAKDEWLLSKHNDIQIRWRISGKIGDKVGDILQAMVDRSRGRFKVEYTQ